MNRCINHCNFIGRLTAEPQVKVTRKSEKMASFTIAVNDGIDKVLFLNCTGFGEVAATIEKYVTKGQKIAVSGYLKQDKYTDRTGVERTSTYLVYTDFAFCESKKKAEPVQNGEDEYEDEIPFK